MTDTDTVYNEVTKSMQENIIKCNELTKDFKKITGEIEKITREMKKLKKDIIFQLGLLIIILSVLLTIIIV